MSTYKSVSAVQSPKMLSVLETLRLEGCAKISLQRLDLSACRRLQTVVLNDLRVNQVLLPSGSKISCRLFNLCSKLQDLSARTMRTVFGLFEEIELWLPRDLDWSSKHLLKSLNNLSRLKVYWPTANDEGASKIHESVYHEGAVSWLVDALPALGQPLLNLRSIILEATSIKVNNQLSCILSSL